ncbi:MAG TPA: aminoglycoside phosphotransferase family protein [Thermoanaerobaculia bacterium]|jgi:aminoglycoside phosphotransferase (APT) family kinase protein
MIERDVVARLVPSVFPCDAAVTKLVPLIGGLESSVSRMTLRREDRSSQQIVIKRVQERREADRYQLLDGAGLTPRLHGVADHDGSTYLFLESVRGDHNWPWSNSANTRLVLEQLARVHALGSSVDDWNYEDELIRSAEATLAVAEESVRALPEVPIRHELRALRRIVTTLPELRRQLMPVLGRTLIHGDAHSGNVVLRGGRVILLDWGRSRAGSPLEDVSSWLLSLRMWEPAAGRDHDALFRAYLTAAGRAAELTDEIRDAYWIAAASNALAGALRYNLLVAVANRGARRVQAAAHARAGLRVIRRADERGARGSRSR